MPGDPLNHPRDTGGIENIIELFNCLIDGKNTAYVSVPITTGHRFLGWYKQEGCKLDPGSIPYKEAHARAVIQPNIADAKQKIIELRHRCQPGYPVLIDPSAFNWPEWTQDDYRYFWGKVIERYVKAVIFLPGWQYSNGCAFEFLTAVLSGADTLDERLAVIAPQAGLDAVNVAIKELYESAAPSGYSVYLKRVADELGTYISREGQRPVCLDSLFETWLGAGVAETADSETEVKTPREYLKDEVLDRLAMIGNVAQFVSFGPGKEPEQRFSRVSGFEPNQRFTSTREAIEYLMKNSPEGTVNIRGFKPGILKGEPLYYGLDNVDSVLDVLQQKSSDGKFSIVNETIDIHDGGVSGVAMGQVFEFSPGDTPKCVDKPGICRLPRDIGLNLLEKIYGFRPALNFPLSHRVEFSIHPKKRGIRHAHTIIWELEEVNAPDSIPDISWPNNFSRMLGDKAYGLLIADSLGLPTPLTTVISRTVAPFTFGSKTGLAEVWMRTCPDVRSPGKYPTSYGWQDPFKMMAALDHQAELEPGAARVASVLAQEAVTPVYSGSLIPGGAAGKEPYIEGVQGAGDAFMVGRTPPEALPGEVIKAVQEIYLAAFQHLGPVEMEWVFDGKKAWLVQLHKSEASALPGIIYGGEAGTFIEFKVEDGLEALRKLIAGIAETNTDTGIILIGDVGITSHFGDLLRRARIPSRLKKAGG